MEYRRFLFFTSFLFFLSSCADITAFITGATDGGSSGNGNDIQPLTLSANTGSDGGTVSLTIAYPNDTSNYTSVDIVAKENSAPTSCSDGTTVQSIGPPFISGSIEIRELAGNGNFHFLACVTSESGTVFSLEKSGHEFGPVTSNHYTIFFSSSSSNGNLGGITGADSTCQSLADGVPLAGTWKAVISDSTIDAVDRITVSGEVRLPTSAVVTSAAEDSFFSNGAILLSNGVNVTETSGGSGTLRAWTGSGGDGTNTGTDCSGWTATGGSGTAGDKTTTNATWLNDTGVACTGTAALYCINGQ